MSGEENLCPRCGRVMKAGKWYSQPGRRYMNLSTCAEHGRYLVRTACRRRSGTLQVSRLLYEGDSEAAKAYEKVATNPPRRPRRHRKKKKSTAGCTETGNIASCQRYAPRKTTPCRISGRGGFLCLGVVVDEADRPG